MEQITVINIDFTFLFESKFTTEVFCHECKIIINRNIYKRKKNVGQNVT